MTLPRQLHLFKGKPAEMSLAAHHLGRARLEGNCLCLGNGNYYPTYYKGGRPHSERIAQLVCRVEHGPKPKLQSVVMHSCDNKACINPDHLSWGTQSKNLKDAFARGHVRPPQVDYIKHLRQGTHHAAKLRLVDIEVIRSRLACQEKLADIAKDFGVSFQQISKIKHGQRWRHL